VPVEAVADTVGLPVAATVANDYPSVVKALNKGVLLAQQAPRAPVTRELDALAGLVGASDAAVEHAPRSSMLQRFFATRLNHGT
jgi:pilus assembly protein CpaE